MNKSHDDQVQLNFQKMQAKLLQTQKQQGLGKQIISCEAHGYRLVAVGNQRHYEKVERWKTFHDFLLHYFCNFFDKAWADQEKAKPLESRHPVFVWREMTFQFMRANQTGLGGINTAIMTGAMSAQLHLAYNLYLLAHNVGIQQRLVSRLKDITLFRGALYETYVAAEFIKAGFSLEFENEEDSRSTHCEFSAISKETGRKYSIEAKAREPNKQNVGIGNQLYEAFKKEAKHERVIFIDVNAPDFLDKVEVISKEIRDKEKTLTIKGQPAPPAYIFVTNHPFEYDLVGMSTQQKAGFADGYKIPEFSFNQCFFNVRDVLKARKDHQDMHHLVKSICEHHEIPATFDGELPEFAFSDSKAPVRLVIGNKYLVPDENGKEEPAILLNASVAESEKKIYGVYKTLLSQKQVIYTNPITDEELIAYKKHPEVFFGIPLSVGGKASQPMEIFDFFYNCYKHSTREKLLEFVKDRSDFESIKNLSTEELLITCCEGWTYSAMNTNKSNET